MAIVVRYLSMILIAGWLLGCPNTKTAGGTSTTENYIQVRLISDSLHKPTTARVQIVDQETWYQNVQAGIDPVMGIVQVDSTGLFSFQVDRNCMLYFVNDLGEMALSSCRDLDVSGSDFVLSAGRIVNGVLQQSESTVQVTKAWIEGSDLSVDVVDGKYQFHSVPKGAQRVVLQTADSTDALIAATALPVDGNTEDTLQLYGTGRVLLEDFEDGNAQGLMNRYFPSGAYWWQSVRGEGSLTPKVDRNADFINPNGGWRGAGLDVEMSASGSDHSIIGLDLGTSKTSTVSKGEYDLSKMHSIHFMAKGIGSVELQFSTGVMSNESIEGTFTYDLTLTDVWTRYEISPSDLQLKPSLALVLPGYTWAEASLKVRSVEFVTMNGNVHLQLDELIIEGINPLEMFGF